MTARRPRILCVDDHADICDLVAGLLDGYQVIQAPSINDAIDKAKTGEFDLFLLDYFLPDGNGIDLCRLIRKFDSRTPIVFVTVARPLTKLNGETLGFQGVIEKHHIADQLPGVVAKLLHA